MGRIILYFYIFLLCVCNISSILDIPPQSNDKRNKEIQNSDGPKDDTKTEEKPVEISINTEKKDDQNTHLVKTDDKNINPKPIDDNKKKNVSPNNNTTTSKILANDANIKTSANTEIESGAVMRGIFVFVGITMICIMYIGFKTYFRRGNKKNPLIKKYGVRTRRSDLEMEPLPLEEDEEDETVFDLGNVTNR